MAMQTLAIQLTQRWISMYSIRLVPSSSLSPTLFYLLIIKANFGRQEQDLGCREGGGGKAPQGKRRGVLFGGEFSQVNNYLSLEEEPTHLSPLPPPLLPCSPCLLLLNHSVVLQNVPHHPHSPHHPHHPHHLHHLHHPHHLHHNDPDQKGKLSTINTVLGWK